MQGMFFLHRPLLLCALLANLGWLNGGVVKLTVERREAFPNQAQPYERLTGHFSGELDPNHPLNAIIADIEFAPRNARGMVEYSATFTILKPTDMAKASGVLVYQVANRGTTQIAGGGYFADFRARGHVLVAGGWQADIAPSATLETMVTPIAKNADGPVLPGRLWRESSILPQERTRCRLFAGVWLERRRPRVWILRRRRLLGVFRRREVGSRCDPLSGRSQIVRKRHFLGSRIQRRCASRRPSMRRICTS
jgi:hypothetical protein